MRRRWRAVLGLIAACGSPPPPEHRGVEEEQVSPAHAAEDSLVMRTADGIEVWFVGGRKARNTAGHECLERSLEIRDSSRRRGVPLLFTLESPTRLDDSSIQATVFNHCAPGDRYRVSLRTGRPTPLPPR